MSVKISKPVGHSGTHQDRCGKDISWGDHGAARATTEEYREGLDKVDFSSLKTEKRSYRVKVNGQYVDDHLYEPKEDS